MTNRSLGLVLDNSLVIRLLVVGHFMKPRFLAVR